MKPKYKIKKSEEYKGLQRQQKIIERKLEHCEKEKHAIIRDLDEVQQKEYFDLVNERSSQNYGRSQAELKLIRSDHRIRFNKDLSYDVINRLYEKGVQGKRSLTPIDEIVYYSAKEIVLGVNYSQVIAKIIKSLRDSKEIGMNLGNEEFYGVEGRIGRRA